MNKRMALLGSVLLASLLGATSAQAAEPLDGAALYTKKTCVACHGKDAKSPVLPSYPKLAGQSADYSYAQILDIKSGARANGQSAAMKGVLHLVSDEEARAIADWIAKQP